MSENAAAALTDDEMRLVARAGVMATEQLKVARQVVIDGGFASATVTPILVAAVMQAIAINQSTLR